jgi:hypothetical protein
MHDSGEIAPRECGLVPFFSVMPRHRVGANAPPGDRLQRLLRLSTSASGILDRPVKPGEDAGESGCLKFKSGKIAGYANHDRCKIKFSSISRKLK